MNIDELLADIPNMREEAKKYAASGMSIIVVGKNKVPLIPWKEFTTRRATAEEIDVWFDRFPEAQIGLVTGKISNVTVVDIEKEGGPEMWNRFPQDCAISQTGGGGRHYFYEYAPGIKNAVRILDNVDLRGDGGYVVLPPSTSDKGQYSWIQRAACTKFPKHLFNLPEQNTGGSSEQVDVKDLANIFLQTAVLNYRPSGEGGRNNSLTKFAGVLISEVHPLKWDSDVWPALYAANKKEEKPLDDYEMQKIYASVKQSEVNNNPLRWKKDDPLANIKPGDDDIILMSEAAEQGSVDLKTFYPLGIELFDKETRGGCHTGDLIAIAGMPGEGKTSWAMNLTKNFIRQGHKVLFFSYEMNVEMVWEKFETMGVQKTDMIYVPRKIITGSTTWIENQVRKAKEEKGVKFIVIDHLSFLTGKIGSDSKMSENYSVALTNIVRDLKDLARAEDVIIILPVHVRKQANGFKKNDELDMNSIAHTAGVAQLSDLVFIMQREKRKDSNSDDIYTGHTSIAMVKNRWGHKNPKGYFEMINEQFIFDKSYFGQEKPRKTETKIEMPAQTKEDLMAELGYPDRASDQYEVKR